MPPQPPAVTIQSLTPDGGGWYVVWGSSASQQQNMQLITFWALGTDGKTIVPIIVRQDTGVLDQASNVSQDYSLSHPNQWSRNEPSTWP